MKIDYPVALSIFFVFQFLLIIIGLYEGKLMSKVHVDEYLDEFYTAGRGLGAFAAAMMISAAYCSAGTFLGGPGLVWAWGPCFALAAVAQIFAAFYVYAGFGKKIGIICRRINAQTVVDIFKYRYDQSKFVVILSAIILVVFLSTQATAEFVGGARVLEAITGLPYFWGLSLCAAVVILYTTLGGMKASALAIVVQGSIMTIVSIILLFATVRYAGGIETMFKAIVENTPEFITPSGTQHFGIRYIGSLWILFAVATYILPHSLMGTLTFSNVRAMRSASIIGAVVVFFWTVGIIGLTAIAGRAVNPELAVPDYNVPMIAFASLPEALAGVVLAGVAAAIQSSIAVIFIVLTGAIVKNIYKDYINPYANDARIKKITRGANFTIGIIVFILALTSPPMLEILIILALGGLIASMSSSLFGLYWPRGNKYGSIGSMLGGLIYYIISSKYLTDLALGMDPVIMATAVSIVIMIVASLLTPKPSVESLQLFWGYSKGEEH